MQYNHTGMRNRLNGDVPKVGIRAIIDGRRNGVRESLEDKTISLANLVAELISRELKHYTGQTVEAIVSETTIGGVAEAVRCSDYFRKQNVGAIIDVTYAWAYASELMEMDPMIPKAIWGFNGSQKPGAVYLAGAIAACEQKGFPVFKIYGKDLQDMENISIPEDVAEQILHFAKPAIAVSAMKGKSYLSMGGVCMGIGGSIIDPNLFQTFFGMRNEYIDMSEFVRRFDKEIYDRNELTKALAWIKDNCKEMDDPNIPEIRESRGKKKKNWETVVKMTLIARDLMIGNPELAKIGYKEESEGHNAIAAGFQGQRQWTDYFPNGDFMEAVLNSSFDWNGIRAPFMVATENDSLNGLSMLLGNLLTGTAQAFCDVRAYWSPEAVNRVTNHELNGLEKDGFIYLTNSGACAMDCTGEMEIENSAAIKPHWKVNSNDADKCVKATKWGPGKLMSFRGGGYSSSFKTRGGMPITMIRMNLVKELGPVLQLAEGYSIELPENVEAAIIKRTDPTWPKTFFVPKLTGEGVYRSVYTVMKAWGSNHCSFSYGHIGKDIITLASMLRIPVAMHNVPDEDIARPSAWDSFGTKDLEGADFRACKAFGPLYGKY